MALSATGQPETQAREPGDQQECNQQQAEERDGGSVDLEDIVTEAMTGQKQVDAHWRRAVADLQIGQENDPEMNRVDAEGQRNRNDQGGQNHQGGKDVQHHAGNQEKQVDQHQKDDLGVDQGGDPGQQLLRNLGINHGVGRGQGHAEDDQDRADQHHRLADDAGQSLERDFPTNEHQRDQHPYGS